MKRYLITGALTLVASAALVSCHSDEDFGSSIIEQKMQAYEQVFEEEFGKIDPNQDWGFGTAQLLARTRAASSVRTRGNYADSNHWGATAESDPADPQRGWIVPDTLTDGQRLRVTRYFQTHPYLTYVDPQWEDFFVQQVYTGGTNVLTGNEPYKNQVYPPSPEIYRSGDRLPNESPDITSNKLNYLFAYGETEHISNFNAATASYKPVLETGEDVNDPNRKMHNDRINLMVHSSTQEFSYQNAYSSNRHALPYVALVGAETIDLWADSVKNAYGETIGEPVYYGQTYSGKDNSYWNRSFLGCDLELLIGDDVYLKGYWDNYGQYQSSYKYYKPETYGNTYKYLKPDANQFGGDLRKYNDEPQGDELAWLLANGYLPRYNSADKDWIKPLRVADHYYSDWIVTLCEAKRQGEDNPNTITIPIEEGSQGADEKKDEYYQKISFDPVGSGRVFCEDLGVVRASDIDFNDIVYDVLIYKTETIVYHKIKKNGEWVDDTEGYPDGTHRQVTETTYNGDVWLLAGGGTIPASIQVGGYNYSVKNVYNDPDITDQWIVNTIENDEGRYGNRYKIFNYGIKLNAEPLAITSVADVDVYVTYNGHVGKLVAYKGVAPHKICVPLDTKWLKEREEISHGYPYFDRYVKYQDAEGNSLTSGPGVIDNPDTTEGGQIGDGNNYDYDERANSVWTSGIVESALYSLNVDYTPRHSVQGWDESEIFIREVVTSSGSTSGGYQEGDPVLIRRKH